MSDPNITIPERILALLILHAAAHGQTPDEVAVALLDAALSRPSVDADGNPETPDLAPALDRAEAALLGVSEAVGDLRGLAARRAASMATPEPPPGMPQPTPSCWGPNGPMAASGSLPAIPTTSCCPLHAPRPPYVGTRTKVDIRLPSAVVAAAVWWADDEDRAPIDLLTGILDAHFDATPEAFPTLPTVPKVAASWISLTLDDGLIAWIEQRVTDGRGADDVLAGILHAHLADRVDAYHAAADKRRADLWDFAGVDISARDGAGNARIHLVRPPGQRSLRLWVDRRHVTDITTVVDAIRTEIAVDHP